MSLSPAMLTASVFLRALKNRRNTYFRLNKFEINFACFGCWPARMVIHLQAVDYSETFVKMNLAIWRCLCLIENVLKDYANMISFDFGTGAATEASIAFPDRIPGTVPHIGLNVNTWIHKSANLGQHMHTVHSAHVHTLREIGMTPHLR